MHPGVMMFFSVTHQLVFCNRNDEANWQCNNKLLCGLPKADSFEKAHLLFFS